MKQSWEILYWFKYLIVFKVLVNQPTKEFSCLQIVWESKNSYCFYLALTSNVCPWKKGEIGMWGMEICTLYIINLYMEYGYLHLHKNATYNVLPILKGFWSFWVSSGTPSLKGKTRKTLRMYVDVCKIWTFLMLVKFSQKKKKIIYANRNVALLHVTLL